MAVWGALFCSTLPCFSLLIHNSVLFCLKINLTPVCAAPCSRPHSSVRDCVAWKVQRISRDSPGKKNNNPVLLWAFFHVQSRFSWTHTHTMKQLVTSTLAVSPCSTGLLRFDLFFCSSFSLGGVDKSWHSSTLLRVFHSSVWYQR